ncbi:HNH endonuclease [Planococcus rifietoensis]|uniref:HNH endonuclease n=1 Tax=Planococcus rifietoensis TaxID=200991 RepID=UPI003850A5E5
MDDYKPLTDPFIYPVSTSANLNSKRSFLGNKVDRKCIYCGKSEDEVTFEKDAHVIPAGLGNKILFNFEECDICNEEYFSVHENELANFLMLDRIFIGSSKRNGLPKYKPVSNGNSSIKHSADSRKVNIDMDNLEGRFQFEIDEQRKTFTLTINKPLPYRPVDICKALVHMIWPFLSEEYRKEISYIPGWLKGERNVFPLFLEVLFVPGNGFKSGILECWKSDNLKSKYPFIVRFTFGLKILTLYIPSSPSILEDPPHFNNYWQLPENIEDLNGERYRILKNDRLTPENLTYTFNFQSHSVIETD